MLKYTSAFEACNVAIYESAHHGRTNAESVIAVGRALDFPTPARERVEVLLTPDSAQERHKDGRWYSLRCARIRERSDCRLSQ